MLHHIILCADLANYGRSASSSVKVVVYSIDSAYQRTWRLALHFDAKYMRLCIVGRAHQGHYEFTTKRAKGLALVIELKRDEAPCRHVEARHLERARPRCWLPAILATHFSLLAINKCSSIQKNNYGFIEMHA